MTSRRSVSRPDCGRAEVDAVRRPSIDQHVRKRIPAGRRRSRQDRRLLRRSGARDRPEAGPLRDGQATWARPMPACPFEGSRPPGSGSVKRDPKLSDDRCSSPQTGGAAAHRARTVVSRGRLSWIRRSSIRMAAMTAARERFRSCPQRVRVPCGRPHGGTLSSRPGEGRRLRRPLPQALRVVVDALGEWRLGLRPASVRRFLRSRWW